MTIIEQHEVLRSVEDATIMPTASKYNKDIQNRNKTFQMNSPFEIMLLLQNMSSSQN